MVRNEVMKVNKAQILQGLKGQGKSLGFTLNVTKTIESLNTVMIYSNRYRYPI